MLFIHCKYTSVLVLRAGQLSALVKCTSRLAGNKLVSNWTNLNRVSNNKHCKYYCVNSLTFFRANQSVNKTIIFLSFLLSYFEIKRLKDSNMFIKFDTILNHKLWKKYYKINSKPNIVNENTFEIFWWFFCS